MRGYIDPVISIQKTELTICLYYYCDCDYSTIYYD